MEAVTWEEHFQALRDVVAETCKDEPGSPVAVHFLGLLRELVRLFPQLMEEEETRLDFLAPDVGDSFSFVLRPPVGWDWEAMAPTFPETGSTTASRRDAAALSAISKGLAWFVSGGERKPVLFLGLRGLTPFPEAPLSPIPAGLEHDWKHLEVITAEDIAEGLGYSTKEILSAAKTHGPILPWGLTLGGEAPLTTPAGGFPFDEDLAGLLNVGAPAWSGLQFKGELHGHPWESSFFMICRGLEVDEDKREAYFLLEMVPTWWAGRLFRRATNPPPPPSSALDDLGAMKTAVMEWGPAEWSSWAETITQTLGGAIDRLRGLRVDVTVPVEGVTGTALVGLGLAATEGADTASASMDSQPIPAGVSSGSLVITGTAAGTYGVEEVETVLRAVSWTSDTIRTSHLAQSQLRALNSLARGLTKARNLYREEESRIVQGMEELDRTGQRPEWLLESRKRGVAYELTKTEKDKIRTTLLGDRSGFIERDRGGTLNLVTGIPTTVPGEMLELQLGGEGLPFLNRQALKAMQESARRELADLSKREQTLADEVDRALIQPLDELQEVQRGIDRVRRKQDIYTSWGMAKDLFEHLVEEVAAQGRTTIEVDALAMKDWLWAGREAPDNWLQTVSETLALLFKQTAATAKGGKVVQGGSFITIRGTRHREHPTTPLSPEDAKKVKGGSLVYTILVNEALLGAISLLKTGTRTLTSGVETETLETGKLTKDQTQKVRARGDRFGMLMAHMDALLKAQGFDEVEVALAKHLSSFLTKVQGGVDRKWTTRIKGGKNPDGTIFRQYDSRFGCPLLPAEGIGFLWGALGTFDKSPERGWEMGGRPTPSAHKGGLLYHMGLDLPQGADDAGRKRVYLKGLKALRRVVLELGEGVLALKDREGRWHNLGASIPEPMVLHLLKEGLVFPFVSPHWEDKIRTSYEAKTGNRLARGIAEADKVRWEARPSTPENSVEGIPLEVLLETELKERGLTKAQGAAALGVSAPMVSLWIKGRKPISKESGAKIRAWIKERP